METTVEFDWDDIIRHHEWKDGKDTFDITILDIDPVNRKIKILSKKGNIAEMELINLYEDELGFLYFCYPYTYSEEIYIQESYL